MTWPAILGVAAMVAAGHWVAFRLGATDERWRSGRAWHRVEEGLPAIDRHALHLVILTFIEQRWGREYEKRPAARSFAAWCRGWKNAVKGYTAYGMLGYAYRDRTPPIDPHAIVQATLRRTQETRR